MKCVPIDSPDKISKDDKITKDIPQDNFFTEIERIGNACHKSIYRDCEAVNRNQAITKQ